MVTTIVMTTKCQTRAGRHVQTCQLIVEEYGFDVQTQIFVYNPLISVMDMTTVVTKPMRIVSSAWHSRVRAISALCSILYKASHRVFCWLINHCDSFHRKLSFSRTFSSIKALLELWPENLAWISIDNIYVVYSFVKIAASDARVAGAFRKHGSVTETMIVVKVHGMKHMRTALMKEDDGFVLETIFSRSLSKVSSMCCATLFGCGSFLALLLY